MPLNHKQMIYDIMKEPSLGSEGLRIIKSILIWKNATQEQTYIGKWNKLPYFNILLSWTSC